MTLPPGQKWILHESVKLKFQAPQWQSSGRDSNVSAGSHIPVNFVKERYFVVFPKRSLKSFVPHKLRPHLCLMAWGGGADISGKGEKEGRKPENDFHVCKLMRARCCPVSPSGRDLKNWGRGESRDPSQIVPMKFGKGQRAWETLGSHRGRDDTALTGSSRVTMRQGCASRTQ